MKPPAIQSTNQYSLFKRVESNREVNKTSLKKLVKRISEKNFLHLFPIICNVKMEVIDGQHRLAAAQELRTDIFYIVDATVTKSDIATINNTRKGWSGKDYVSFYAKEQNEHYIKLQTLTTKFPRISIGVGMKLLEKDTTTYFTGGNYTENLRNGNIDSTNYELAMQIGELCDRMSAKRFYVFQGPFLLAVKSVLSRSGKSVTINTERIFKMAHVLPLQIDKTDSCLPRLREIIAS